MLTVYPSHALDTAVAAHEAIRHFAVTYPVVWTAAWQLVAAVGTLFVPAWGLPLLKQGISWVKTYAEKSPNFDKKDAENINNQRE